MTAHPAALFAGLCTFDLIQAIERMPGPNEKVTALRQLTAAGGPATNAAVTFAFLGGQATLLTGIGHHPLAHGIRADLRRVGVRLIDMAEATDSPPPVSSILITEGTSHRAVISLNATSLQLATPPSPEALAGAAQAVLVDGHHPALALAAARAARERGRLCVLDGGSWKPVTADLLPFVDLAVCSADFRPPGEPPGGDVLGDLLERGAGWAVITDGPRPVRWASRAHGRQPDISVPATSVRDTLGAGDIFHGALTYAITAHGPAQDPAQDPGQDPAHGPADVSTLGAALQFAARVAAHSCQTFGTRSWMSSWPGRVSAYGSRDSTWTDG